MITIIAVSLVVNIVLAILLRMVSISSIGIFSPICIRAFLRLYSFFHIPCSVIVYDIRKMHELNAILGYAYNNSTLLPKLTKVCRRQDVMGQYGGDEFVVIAPPRACTKISQRILRRAEEITANMTVTQRDALRVRTHGIVDGLHIALACEQYTRDAFGAAERMVDKTEDLKENGTTCTGVRATTGNIGTLIFGL